MKPKIRIIRDPRDATRDYRLTEARARQIFAEGKLCYDGNNECYAHMPWDKDSPPKG